MFVNTKTLVCDVARSLKASGVKLGSQKDWQEDCDGEINIADDALPADVIYLQVGVDGVSVNHWNKKMTSIACSRTTRSLPECLKLVNKARQAARKEHGSDSLFL